MGGVQRVDEVEEEDANARMGSDVSVWQQMDDAGCKLKVTVTLTCVERVAQVINHKTMGAVQLLTAKWSDFFFVLCP